MSSGTTAVPDRDEDTLAYALRVVLRRKLIVVVAVVVGVVVAIASHATSTRTYNATASIAFGVSSLPSIALDVDTSSDNPERDAATNVLVARSREVAEGVRRQLDATVSPEELLDAVSVEAVPNANVLDISATSTDPQTAADVANAFADQYIAFQTRTELTAIDRARRALESQLASLPEGSAERASLEGSLQRLAQLSAVANGGARVISRASVPTTPSGMGYAMTIALGAIAGLALGLTIAFLIEAVDRRIGSIAEFEREYRLRVLAGVPPKGFRRRRAVDRRDDLEPYRILRSALDLAAGSRPLEVILVTSAVPGEGKTTVAVDLAQAIALADRRVTLVELDLRRPSFADQLDVDPQVGVTTALLGPDVPARDLVVMPFPDMPELGVMPSGPLPANPAELLSSPALRDLLDELAEETTVVIDAPPLNAVADTQELLNNARVHGTVIVARERKTTRDQVRAARAILDRQVVRLLGVVVTDVREERRAGYVASRRAAAHDGTHRRPRR